MFSFFITILISNSFYAKMLLIAENLSESSISFNLDHDWKQIFFLLQMLKQV